VRRDLLARLDVLVEDASTDEHQQTLIDACDEIRRLLSWKQEALLVLQSWENVHTALGEPARLGESKADACTNEALRLTTEVLRLRDALAEAVEDIEHWAGYASEYFREKWDLAGDLAKYRAVLGEEES
jgi:hypothetical protein